MKEIINNKKYDTNTATLIGSWSNGYRYNDFNYCGEDLYRKKTGEFFLYGEGGPLTTYATISGNDRGYGETIIPLSDDEAREWAVDHLDVDKFEHVFGEVEE